MQTLLSITILIFLAIIVYRQHLSIQRLYKISQGQKVVNESFNAQIQSLSKDQMELRGQINRSTGKAKPLELPSFIAQPQSRYIGGQFNVN